MVFSGDRTCLGDWTCASWAPEALRRRVDAFRRDQRGVTIVEFALVAPVFFLFLFSAIEIALISFSTSTFHTGLAYASRLVRTGDAQCFSDDEFIGAICGRASFAPECAARTEITRQVFSVGYATDPDLAIDVAEFAALASGDVVMIRAAYRWPVLSPIVAPFLAEEDGAFAYEVSFLFKNEEFVSATCE